MAFAGYYDNIGSDIHDHYYEGKDYRQFAQEHFGIYFEDDEDKDA